MNELPDSGFVDADAARTAARQSRANRGKRTFAELDALVDEVRNPAPEVRALLDEHWCQRGLVVRRQITELLHIFDERINHCIQIAAAVETAPTHDGGGDPGRALGVAEASVGEIAQKGHDEPSQHVDLHLERIEAILQYPRIVFAAHQRTPEATFDEDFIEAAIAAHRLSAVPK